tara:strand:+ start:1544 stop:1966 length:423 start_codon:yes stop_codon:yes gene_type:complete
MKTILVYPILLLGITTLIITSCSQKYYSIANRSWDAYIVDEKGGDTTNNYFMTYTFKTDGTFEERHKNKDISKINQTYEKNWELNKNLLTVILKRKSDGIQKNNEYYLEWLDKFKFFTVEVNEVTGVKTYVYYYLVKLND